MKKIILIAILILLVPLVATAGFFGDSSRFKVTDSGSSVTPVNDRNVVMGVARVEVTTSSTLTDAQTQRSMVTNYGMASGGDTTLPAFSGSTSFIVMTEAASQAWSLKPPSGEAFVLDGTALDADDEIDIGQTVGNSGQLVRIRTGASTYQWYFFSIQGTHADGGAS